MNREDNTRPDTGTLYGGRGSRDVTDCRLLIVEDTLLSREIIGAYLRSDGFKNIEFAVDGIEALEKIDSFQPDLMVLDIVMPRMDGFGVCREIRSRPDLDHLPILVQTALDEPEERVKVFTVGATDLVTKPINKNELLARVRIHLENQIFLTDLRDYHDRTQTELNMARDMQGQLLPRPDSFPGIRSRHGLQIGSHFETSSELGGDFWGLHEIDDTRMSVFITDFSGHGVTAALNTFRLHTLIQQQLRDHEDPGEYMMALNRKLAPLLPVGQYATMLYGVIDTKRDKFTFATAATTAPIVGNDDPHQVKFLDGSGIPLGIIDDAVYENREIDFPPGTFLFLYSDALTETMDEQGNALFDEGLERLVKIALAQTGRNNILDRILSRFFARVKRPLPDDLTAVLVNRVS